jgi:hypothetical protein
MEEAEFSAIVRAWAQYLADHDGDVPPDPYLALANSGGPAMRELRWLDFLSDVPPRFYPDTKRNGRWLVFARDMKNLGEVWNCYSEGTWERVKLSPNGQYRVPPSRPALNSIDRLKEAGYPVWKWRDFRDRAAWLAQNKKRLVWNCQLGMYVVSPRPETRAAGPEATSAGEEQ